jgi:hypothetical protein
VSGAVCPCTVIDAASYPVQCAVQSHHRRWQREHGCCGPTSIRCGRELWCAVTGVGECGLPLSCRVVLLPLSSRSAVQKLDYEAGPTSYVLLLSLTDTASCCGGSALLRNTVSYTLTVTIQGALACGLL